MFSFGRTNYKEITYEDPGLKIVTLKNKLDRYDAALRKCNSQCCEVTIPVFVGLLTSISFFLFAIINLPSFESMTLSEKIVTVFVSASISTSCCGFSSLIVLIVNKGVSNWLNRIFKELASEIQELESVSEIQEFELLDV